MSSQPEATVAASILREAIDLRRLGWIRPLVADYTQRFDAVAPLFAGDPADAAAWRATIARVQREPRDRAAIAAVAGRQLDDRRAPAAARTAAALLADPTTVTILTGQQAGVLGGPLYTLLKAVTAVQLARQVSARHGVPAVAVFWVDADDHDWEEIRSASVLDAAFEVRTLSLATLTGAGAQPVGRLTLDAGVENLLASAEAALPPTEFTPDVLARLRAHYRPGVRVSTAFAGWLDELLGAQGLVAFESADRDARPLLGDLWAAEAGHPGRTTDLARLAGAAMRRLGHEPQVEPAADATGLFTVDGSGRRPVRQRDGEYLVGDAVRTPAALAEEARRHPDRFSPNVLLRPLAQDRLFPTVCYVAGPSELAYHAQLGDVYRAFGIERPLLYSRATATLLDSAAARFLDRYQVPLEALQERDESALNRLLDSQLPPSIERTLAELDRLMADRLAALQPDVSAVDPTLAGAVDTTLQKMRDTARTLHAKIVQASKRKDDTLRRQFFRTRTLAFPGGAPQERTLSVAFFANRYGLGLGARLLDVLPLDTSKHYLIVL